MDLYLIPGLGSDGRLFARLELPGHAAHCLEWPAMPAGSSLRDYAAVLARSVDADRDHALIGMSMGGMVAQEMAAITRPKRTVIVSSWKGPQEMPAPIRLLRGTHAERLLTPAFRKHLMPLVRWQMGVEGEDDGALLDAFVDAVPLAQMRVQAAAVLGWEGPQQPVQGLVHIHGDQDRLMPLGPIQAPVIVIEGGGHLMVYNRAAEVGSAMRKAISSTG